MSDQGGSLRDRIDQWLASHGYPFEMSVAQAFRDAGFETWQADFVLSQDGKTLRDVDVAASLEAQLFHFKDGKDGTPISLGNGVFETTPFEPQMPAIHWDVLVVAECKQPKARAPWIMFSSEPSVMEAMFAHGDRLGNPAGQRLLRELGLEKDVPSLLRTPELCGHALVQAFGDGNDEHPKSPYLASLQVVDQALGYCAVTDRGEAHMRTCRLVVPALVVDAPLFECFVDEQGVRHLEPRAHMRLYWRRRQVPGVFTIIDVVNREGLPAFVESVRELHAYFRDRRERLHAAVAPATESAKPTKRRRKGKSKGPRTRVRKR